jgi:5-formyltetrahydrofolate cyclo-ligase
MLNKSDLRKKYIDKRNSLTPASIADLSLKITEQLFNLIQFKDQTIHVFHSIKIKKEVSTHFIISKLIAEFKDVKIIHSKSNLVTFELTHFVYNETSNLVTNRWGISEPENGEEVLENEIDIVLVPLLALDKNGYRVGYGKGFYDRFLSKCRRDVVKIGLSYFEPENSISDITEFDVALEYCITPRNIYKF